MIAWALEAMVGLTLLMLVVLALRAPVARFCGAQWAYALWLLPVVLPLLGPFLPPLTLVEPAYSPIVIILPAIEPATTTLASPTPGFDWLSLALGLWVGGAALFLSWQQSAYGAFLLHLGPAGRPADPPELGGIKVIESDAVDGPVAVGVFKRRIVVPVDFATRYSETEQRLALEHELIHHRRFDIGWNMVALLILALNWFNPIAHVAFRAFRADQELACDAAVACRSPNARRAYARAIVKSASQGGLIAAAPLNHAAFLKRRLRMMDSHGGGWGRAFGGASVFLLAGAGGLILSSPGQAASDAAPVQPVILAAAERSTPILQPSELATLKSKCDCKESRRANLVVCSGKAAVRDPQVRAIVDRVRERAATHFASAAPSEDQMRDVERTVEQAQAEALATAEAEVEADEAIAEQATTATEPVRAAAARVAVERAQRQLAAVHVRMGKHEARFARKQAHLDLTVSRRLSAEERAEMKRDLAEAWREMRAEFDQEMREAQDELARELRYLRTSPAHTH